MQSRRQRSLPNQTLINNAASAHTPVLFIDHLHELRNRFIWWLLAFIGATCVGFVFYEPILTWLSRPLNSPLYYSSPVGGFEATLEVAIFFGIIVSLPVMVFQLIKFLEPAVANFPRKLIVCTTIASFLLAGTGILIAYYFVVPGALKILGEFGSEQLQPIISTHEYFSFITKYLFGFAVLFQLPLFILLYNQLRPVTPLSLLRKFPYLIAGSFLAAAILTPTPDFVNQTIMALPIIVLYLLSILMVWVNKRIKVRIEISDQ